jgi:hypothetical protein
VFRWDSEVVVGGSAYANERGMWSKGGDGESRDT